MKTIITVVGLVLGVQYQAFASVGDDVKSFFASAQGTWSAVGLSPGTELNFQISSKGDGQTWIQTGESETPTGSGMFYYEFSTAQDALTFTVGNRPITLHVITATAASLSYDDTKTFGGGASFRETVTYQLDSTKNTLVWTRHLVTTNPGQPDSATDTDYNWVLNRR
jgi:hypothetical protein